MPENRQQGKAAQGPTPSANVKTVPRTPSSAEATFGTFQSQYKVLDQPLGTTRPLKVIFLGGGASGINFAYQIRKFLPDVTFQGYEANPEMSGTWFENRYPGCACDIPSHTYQFAWAPNPDWSAYYVGQPEIKSYFLKVVKDHDLAKYFKVSHRIIRGVWDEKTSKWYITIRANNDPSTDFEDSCDFFINGSGILNAWKWPDVPGLQSFKGPLVHSANWPDKLDLVGKRVGIIGVGSTATQIIPAIQKDVKHLTAFVRSKTWITPPIGLKYAGEGGKNVIYTEEQRKTYREDREKYNEFRKGIETELNSRFRFLYKDGPEQKVVFDFFTKWMAEKLPGRPDLAEMLIPDFAVGCRRLTPGGGFLEALMKDNVTLTNSGVKSVTENSIVTADGKNHEVDVLICATGFDLSFKPRFELIGRDGVDLRDKWDPRPTAYLSALTSSFPNYGTVMGPGAPLAQGSMIPSTERIAEYFIQLLFRMSTEPILSIEVKPEVEKELWEHYQEQLKLMVWTSSCSSSFKNGGINSPIDVLHPGSRMHYFALLASVRWDDFNIKFSNNRFSYLGNGLTKREDTGGDLTYYLIDDVLKLPEY
ncbi:hypothetical protein RQP46_000949 [Phenoliferia psychrophenolica]